MDASLRRVAKLRLRSTDEGLNRRGAVLIEDALRTASLPDNGGTRLLVIRKLPLGRIHPNEPPSAIALRLEARCRELGELAVHAASPDAGAAPAVFFQDDSEPYEELALRTARGEDLGAWFWPLAVRGWKPGLMRDEGMRIALAGALSSSAGPTAALALLRTLLRHGALSALTNALCPEDGHSLLQAFGWTQSQSTSHSTAGAALFPVDFPLPALANIALPWFIAWGPEDARSVWLACVLYAIERPGLAAQSALPEMARRWIATLSVERMNPHEAGRLLPAGEDIDQTNLDAPKPLLITASTKETELHLQSAASPRRSHASVLFTSHAGLFFLVPILEHLGIEQWLRENPPATGDSFAYLILGEILTRLGADPDDAIWRTLANVSPDAVEHVPEWRRNVRRYARRSARIGLHSLIERPGKIAFTGTHIDVLFRLEHADIRVRRAGLDIDPGWVPWLGRVIHFHYLGDDSYNAA